MPDLKDGETAEIKGSARNPYIIKKRRRRLFLHLSGLAKSITRHRTSDVQTYSIASGGQAERERFGAWPPALSKSATEGTASAPQLLLANVWENDIDLKGWWMSEKLDGVRAWWTGTHFLSRLGNIYHAPDWFIAGLPNVPLDGELWLDRKAFQRTVSIVRRQDKSDHWQQIKYVMFDAPGISGRLKRGRRPLPSWFISTARAMPQCFPKCAARASMPSKSSWRGSNRLAAKGSCSVSPARCTSRGGPQRS